MKLHTRDSLIATAAALTMILAACSSKKSDDDSGNPDPNTAQGGASGSQGGSVGNTTGGKVAATGGKVAATGGRAVVDTSVTPGTGGSSTLSNLPKACPGFPVSDAPTEDGGVCRGTGKEIEPSTLDMMIAMDRTYSMQYCLDGDHDRCAATGSTEPMRWQVLQQGVEQALANIATMPVLRQPRMGLRFFGHTGNPEDPAECLAATYANPQVAMQDFATASTAIVNAMTVMSKNLGGQTPWQPSLQGVLQYAQDWQKSHMERVTVVLFVTDGYPTICDQDMGHIMTTVGEFYWGVQGDYNTVGKPGIRTFILGVGAEANASDPNSNQYNLDSVAYAGGTNQATIANDTAAVGEFATSLSNISNSKIDCDFALPTPPTGEILNIDKVQVVYEPYKGDAQEIPSASSAGGCGTANGGWYYDDPVTPTKVILCPCSCANLGAGKINVKFGCRPKPVIG